MSKKIITEKQAKELVELAKNGHEDALVDYGTYMYIKGGIFGICSELAMVILLSAGITLVEKHKLKKLKKKITQEESPQ